MYIDTRSPRTSTNQDTNTNDKCTCDTSIVSSRRNLYWNIARQRRKILQFPISIRPEMQFLDRILQFRDFIENRKFYEIFAHECRPWACLIFLLWIFWRVRLVGSESIYKNLTRDRRKLKSDGWIWSRDQKSARKLLIVTGHSCRQLPPGAIMQYYFTRPGFW